MTPLYRISEATSLLGVCTKTLRRWDHARKLHCLRTAGGHRRIALLEILHLQNDSPIPSSSPRTDAIAIYARVSSDDLLQVSFALD